MCELLAMSANVPTDICFSFAGLLKRGGETGEHKDGWGIVFYEGKGVKVFKDIEPASQSQIAKMLMHYPIKSLQVVGHIRMANVGNINLPNTHPFVKHLYGTNFTFAHNGQIPEIKNLPTDFFEPIGQTDSEHAFCYFLNQMSLKLSKKEVLENQFWDLIFELCNEVSKLGVFNMVMGNGNQLAAFCSTKLSYITRKAPFGKAKLLDDQFSINFAKHTTKKDVVSVIATIPLTKDENWVIMKPNTMAIFELGHLISVKSL